MSVQSKSSSRKTKPTKTTPEAEEAWLRRPFSPKVLRQAETLANEYQITIQFIDGRYYGFGTEYPSPLGDGKTPQAAFKMAREGLVTLAATDLERGVAPPRPISEARDRQINIRVSGYEKQALERAAKQKGFRGIGDFVRHAALSKV
ncbi:MAG: hypothetical protein AAGD32_10045 [Planctomycetota bacterium]